MAETVRYAGTPLKYSFSEVNHKKSALIFDLKEKGNIEITKIPFKPMRDMKEIKELTTRFRQEISIRI